MGSVLMLCVRMIQEDILVRSFPPIRGQNAEICFSHVAVVHIPLLVCDAAAKKRVIWGDVKHKGLLVKNFQVISVLCLSAAA